MPSERAERLLSYLEKRRAEMLGLLRSLVEAESPSREPETQAEVRRLLAAELEASGMRVRRIDGRTSGGQLLATPTGRERGRPVQLLLGHMDTVWPRGTLATMPVVERDGKLHGPGVFDMKGGLAQIVYALRALAATGLQPEVSPVVFVNSDEEVGSRDSRRTVRRLARVSDRVLVLEPAMGRAGRLKTARKGVGQFTVTVRGRAAHAGLEPDRGVSAILELSRLVQSLFALNDPERGITVNVGTIDGGMRPNVVAPEAKALVDVRVLTREQGPELERAIFALKPQTPGARLEISGGIESPPMERTPRNRALWELARAAGRELDLELDECLAGGGSDGNTTSLVAPTLDGLGPIGDGAHAAHEYVEIDKLGERTALLALLLAAPALAWTGRGGEPSAPP